MHSIVNVLILISFIIHICAAEASCYGNVDPSLGFSLPCIRNSEFFIEEAIAIWGPIVFNSFDKKIINSDDDLAIIKTNDIELQKFRKFLTAKFKLEINKGLKIYGSNMPIVFFEKLIEEMTIYTVNKYINKYVWSIYDL